MYLQILLTQKHYNHIVLRVFSYLAKPRSDIVETRLICDIIQQK